MGEAKTESYWMDGSTLSAERPPGARGRPDGPPGPVAPGFRAPQTLLSMNAVSCDFDTAPTLVDSTLPFLNSISVGIPRMP